MEEEFLNKGFMIINGNKAEPLPEFDVPSKDSEEEIIKFTTEELKKEIEIK